MAAKIYRVNFEDLLFMAKKMRKTYRIFIYTVRYKMSFVSYGEATDYPYLMLHHFHYETLFYSPVILRKKIGLSSKLPDFLLQENGNFSASTRYLLTVK